MLCVFLNVSVWRSSNISLKHRINHLLDVWVMATLMSLLVFTFDLCRIVVLLFSDWFMCRYHCRISLCLIVFLFLCVTLKNTHADLHVTVFFFSYFQYCIFYFGILVTWSPAGSCGLLTLWLWDFLCKWTGQQSPAQAPSNDQWLSTRKDKRGGMTVGIPDTRVFIYLNKAVAGAAFYLQLWCA